MVSSKLTEEKEVARCCSDPFMELGWTLMKQEREAVPDLPF